MRILTPIYPLNKLAKGKKINESGFFDDNAYNDLEKDIDSANKKEIRYNQYRTLISEAEEFLNRKVKGITFNVSVNEDIAANSDEMNGDILKLTVKEKSPKSEDYMFIIENEDREIKGNKIAIPSILPQDLLERYVIPNLPEESNKMLKIVKFNKAN